MDRNFAAKEATEKMTYISKLSKYQNSELLTVTTKPFVGAVGNSGRGETKAAFICVTSMPETEETSKEISHVVTFFS